MKTYRRLNAIGIAVLVLVCSLGIRANGQNVTINGVTEYSTSQTMNSLVIGPNGLLRVAPGTVKFIDTHALSIDPCGILDLTDCNVLVVRAPNAATNQANFTAITAWIKKGLNNGASGLWRGRGIQSSTAASDTNHFKAIGVLDNSQVGHTDFEGVTGLTGNEVIVRGTIFGDADLNKVVNPADHLQFLSGLANTGSGWLYGDFNYDGVVDAIKDYALFLNSYNNGPANPATAFTNPVTQPNCPIRPPAVQITGSLDNFDVRYPSSVPNDLEVVLYGAGLTPDCVTYTWDTNTLLSYEGGPELGAQWGPASSITQSVNDDPLSPAFGLDCITIRWAGAPRPALVGQMVHFGVSLKPGCAVAHQEVWWTADGVRILRPCDTHITWICTRTGWLVCLANPTPLPIYVYGPRYFEPVGAPQLPFLTALTTNMDPAQFGGTWQNLALPGGQRVLCIPPWCRIYIQVFAPTWRPIIFQVGARNVSEQVLPLPVGPEGPNPNDIDAQGQNGTMFIMTTRATQEFREDITGDGVVGQPDFNLLRSRFGQSSVDLNPPPPTP